ncbi:hypothetical protein Tco_0270538 [Tanacetum coccineum]
MIEARLEDLKNKFSSKPTSVDYDRDSKILGGLDPFDVLVLCCKMQILSHNSCSEDRSGELRNSSLFGMGPNDTRSGESGYCCCWCCCFGMGQNVSGFFKPTCVRSTSMLGTCTSTIDYSRKIPPGQDIQSATVDEKLSNDKFVSGSTLPFGFVGLSKMNNNVDVTVLILSVHEISHILVAKSAGVKLGVPYELAGRSTIGALKRSVGIQRNYLTRGTGAWRHGRQNHRQYPMYGVKYDCDAGTFHEIVVMAIELHICANQFAPLQHYTIHSSIAVISGDG